MYAVCDPRNYIIKFFEILEEAKKYSDEIEKEISLRIDVIEVKDKVSMEYITDY